MKKKSRGKIKKGKIKDKSINIAQKMTQPECDRCGMPLIGGVMPGFREFSVYNDDLLCYKCYQREQSRPDYEQVKRLKG